MNRRTPALHLLVAATVIAASACQDASEPTSLGVRPTEPLLQQLPQQAHGRPSQEALARAVPGFGGVFLDENGIPTVYLKDPQQRGAIQQALTAFAREHGISPSAIRVLRGNYDYLELDAWFNEAKVEALSDDGGIFADLDEANNRVLIGVVDAAAGARVRAAVARTGVPISAVSIEVREPIRQLATLRDRVRPIVGGLQIHFGRFICSIGFNAVDDGENSFITASHCTDRQGGVEGTTYAQPTRTVDPTVIATEVEDPTYFKGGACIYKGKKCRYSDASRAAYSAGTEFTLGGIAETSGANNGSINIAGTLTINAENTSSEFTVGEDVSKLGRTTGWTRGPVTNTCVDTGVLGTNIVQLCQTFVQAGVAGGDSGSPVFSGNGPVTLYGILWGGGTNSFVFSPFGQVQQELGILTVK